MAKHKQIKEHLANQGEAARVRIKSFGTYSFSITPWCILTYQLDATFSLSLDHKHNQDGI